MPRHQVACVLDPSPKHQSEGIGSEGFQELFNRRGRHVDIHFAFSSSRVDTAGQMSFRTHSVRRPRCDLKLYMISQYQYPLLSFRYFYPGSSPRAQPTTSIAARTPGSPSPLHVVKANQFETPASSALICDLAPNVVPCQRRSTAISGLPRSLWVEAYKYISRSSFRNELVPFEKTFFHRSFERTIEP
jgi:hypothetical protein